jgi:hypothetical protein
MWKCIGVYSSIVLRINVEWVEDILVNGEAAVLIKPIETQPTQFGALKFSRVKYVSIQGIFLYHFILILIKTSEINYTNHNFLQDIIYTTEYK